MASIRDRTEDFKDAVRREAVVLGYNESKMAAIMASFIIHKPRERTQFMKTTLKTLELIGELYEFLKKHRDAYVNRGRTTEEERDSVEQEVSIFVKLCQEQINFLKSSINDEEATLKGWTGIRTGSSNVDTIAHKHGVVLILSEKLHYVTSAFDELRAIRFQDTLDRSTRRKIPDSKPIDHVESRNSEVEEPDEVGSRPQVVQQQFEDDETSALQVELRELLDAAHDTETRMVEVSALGQLMSTHVLHQVHQIEHLYEQAVEATQNVELGNKELSQAIQRNGSSRTFLLLFLFVLTFSVLFLDWYS